MGCSAERFIDIMLNIAVAFFLGLLIISIFSGFAYAEPYQIPDKYWEGVQNCDSKNGVEFAGKHYMRVTSPLDKELRTFCVKAPVKLPNASWDNAIAMTLVRIVDTDQKLPMLLYFEVEDIGSYEMLLVLFNARTGKEYRRVVIYP